MKTCFITLLVLGVGGCLSRAATDPGGATPTGLAMSSFPIGTYTRCAQGTHNPSGNNFVNVSGFQQDAVLTLSQSGTTVTSTYVDQNGLTQSVNFSTMTGTAATVAQRGQVIPGFSSLCVVGPGRESRYPASMTVNSGVLNYNAGTVFVTLTGRLQSDAGECGRLSQPGASFWLLCEDRQEGAPPAVDAGPPPAMQLPVGEFKCSTQIETYALVNGINRYVAGGASGVLTLAQDGAKLTVQYAGDSSLAGTLRLVASSATTANAEPGQTLSAPCMVPARTGLPSATPEPLPVAAGSLTFIDSTLFLSFAGTTAAGSSCPGARVAGTVICAR